MVLKVERGWELISQYKNTEPFIQYMSFNFRTINCTVSELMFFKGSSTLTLRRRNRLEVFVRFFDNIYIKSYIFNRRLYLRKIILCLSFSLYFHQLILHDIAWLHKIAWSFFFMIYPRKIPQIEISLIKQRHPTNYTTIICFTQNAHNH